MRAKEDGVRDGGPSEASLAKDGGAPHLILDAKIAAVTKPLGKLSHKDASKLSARRNLHDILSKT